MYIYLYIYITIFTFLFMSISICNYHYNIALQYNEQIVCNSQYYTLYNATTITYNCYKPSVCY